MIRPEFTVVRHGQTFVLYKGILDLAHELGLEAIDSAHVQILSEDNA